MSFAAYGVWPWQSVSHSTISFQGWNCDSIYSVVVGRTSDVGDGEVDQVGTVVFEGNWLLAEKEDSKLFTTFPWGFNFCICSLIFQPPAQSGLLVDLREACSLN